MLGRKFVRAMSKSQYSRKLEMFNNELQRSEKMEIISELAASVAHEVRNPLQVTRGFMHAGTEHQTGGEGVFWPGAEGAGPGFGNHHGFPHICQA